MKRDRSESDRAREDRRLGVLVRESFERSRNSKHPSPSVKRTLDERAVSLCVVTEDPASAVTQGLVLER